VEMSWHYMGYEGIDTIAGKYDLADNLLE